MTTFMQLPPIDRGILFLWSFLLLLLMIWQFFHFYRLNMSTRSKMCLLGVCFFCFFFFYLCLLMKKNVKLALPDFSVGIIISSQIICSIAVLFFGIIIKKKKKNSITPMSIKEAVDCLPAGLCYYYSGGLCKLVNSKMDEICVKMTGKLLRDGQIFWKILTNGGQIQGSFIQTGNNPIVALKDGTVYSFKRNQINFYEIPLYEIISADVTEEYALSLELLEKQRKGEEINQRLRILGEEITKLSMEKEILNSKIRLHDDWSKALLLLRRYMIDPNLIDSDEMFQIWNRNITLLEMERTSIYQDQYEDIFRVAKTLGFQIYISGKLPEETEKSCITAQAMIACLSNLGRHAKGTKLYVDGKEQNGKFLLSLKNNGEAPKDKIRETGGLANLRRRVEGAGGTMKIESKPEFELKIEL